MSKPDQNQISLSLPGGDLTGTPTEVGLQVYSLLIQPLLIEFNDMDKAYLAHFYAGLLVSLAGSVAADFGKQFAHDMLADFAESAITINEQENHLH